MKGHASHRSAWFVLAAIAAFLPAMAMAQTFPSKPIRIVVGFSAGGSADLMACVAGSKLSAGLGQSAIIDNRPGAGGNIAAGLVATSPAIVKRISEEAGKGLRQVDALEVFERQGLQQSADPPEALAALVAAELAKWAKVIKAAGIPQQ